ncbi:ORF6C domain-containing protein [Clostridium saccharoperbutylacetonicum]|uniref:ORF6C domain-containing protein n=1 Tax=Clostridium saccharoperbutylacetonicum TaxID=36745 RepID=UPI0039EC8879
MNKLMPLEFKSQRIILTKTLSDEFGTEERRITENFKRNEERFVEGKHYILLQGELLREFKSNNAECVSANVNKLYLWTDRGAARHAKILDTDEAWEVYEALEENYFNPKQKQLSPMDQLKLQYQVLENHEQKIDGVIERVDKIENNTTIDYSQQQELNELANKKVVAVLGGKDTPAYKELAKKAFKSFWHDYKNKLNVNSYRNTLIKDFGIGKQAIINWQPNRELELMIKGCNSYR